MLLAGTNARYVEPFTSAALRFCFVTLVVNERHTLGGVGGQDPYLLLLSATVVTPSTGGHARHDLSGCTECDTRRVACDELRVV
jgi:hypothetical protein